LAFRLQVKKVCPDNIHLIGISCRNLRMCQRKKKEKKEQERSKLLFHLIA
jgi:hypothetical protein